MSKRLTIIILYVQCLLTGAISALAQGKHSNEAVDDIKIITQRLVEDYLDKPLNYNKVGQIISSMKTDGSWPDINYDTVSADFPAEVHLLNLKLMAIAYSRHGSSFHLSRDLKKRILSGYDFYINKNPQSLNWWYNQIGAPQDYMVGLILLKNHISDKELIRYTSYLKDLTDNPGHRGMNRIWVSAITLHKGCLENDPSLVHKAFQSVASTLTIADEQGIEGIKIDNSFHQHRPQLYSGGYGMGFAEGTAALMVLSANTSFNKAFSSARKKMFSDMLLHGHQLFSYRKAIDFGTIGRNISRPDAINAISSITLDQMAITDPLQGKAFQNWKFHLQGGSFPENFQGNKYFWKSDIMTHHGPDYYLSAKVISTRTAGTEMLNGENLKGYNLPLGSTNIMSTGEEYKNIFPVWDWTRVPGTTAVMNEAATILPWYLFGANDFAGGVSNGSRGAIAYEHSYNGVQAKKAYFFADDFMLCMGSGINALRTQQVVTSVNQCYLNGGVITGESSGSEGNKFADSMKTFKGNEIAWVYHDGVGYIFPDEAQITIKADTQTGSWKSINASGSEDQISKPVFSLWINHGTAPKDDTYCYIVAPESSLDRFKKKVSTHNFTILKNDKKLQIVKFKSSYFIIFYQPGTAALGNGLEITADVKAMMMVEEKDNGYELSVSDPTHNQSEVNLSLSQKQNGPIGASAENGLFKMNFIFPAGDLSGSTITRFYKKNQ